ncbi:tRNA (guanine-N(7)-)-methyltransferase, partial [Haemophilus influenzae]
KKYDE